jgi:dnd system-associated protein 4
MSKVSRDECHTKLFDQLVKEKTSNVFDTDAQLLVFAATLGYREGKRLPLKNQHPITTYENFVKWNYEGVIDLLALVSTKDPAIFKEKRRAEKIEIFEQYANGGLEYLQNWIDARPLTDDPCECIEEILQELINDAPHDVRDDFHLE